jgi:hypothetical protein
MDAFRSPDLTYFQMVPRLREQILAACGAEISEFFMI